MGEKQNLVNPEIKNIYENFDSSTCGLRGASAESVKTVHEFGRLAAARLKYRGLGERLCHAGMGATEDMLMRKMLIIILGMLCIILGMFRLTGLMPPDERISAYGGEKTAKPGVSSDQRI
jgi:hypothetical protein